MNERVLHNLKPIYNKDSRILILGTFPSPISRRLGFYYANPQNRFWNVISELLCHKKPETKEEKEAFLIENKIAVWDVLASCRIKGAKDGSIRESSPNDINIILKDACIHAVFTTGKAAFLLYNRYCLPETGLEALCLPSTSPANCRYSYGELLKAYSIILKYI